MSRHRFHGDPRRFEVVADFVAERYPRATYVADVAGGQGMLSRLLTKRGFDPEVIDPRGNCLAGVRSRAELYTPDMADYYDLVVGLHPDQALRPVVESALLRPVLVVPCCNFWDRNTKLGRDALLDSITEYAHGHQLKAELVELGFRGPQNHAVCMDPLMPSDG